MIRDGEKKKTIEERGIKVHLLITKYWILYSNRLLDSIINFEKVNVLQGKFKDTFP